MRRIFFVLAVLAIGCGDASVKLKSGLTPTPTPRSFVHVPQDAATPALGFQMAAVRGLKRVELGDITFSASQGNVQFPIVVPTGFTLEGGPGTIIDTELSTDATPVIELNDRTLVSEMVIRGSKTVKRPAITATGVSNADVEGVLIMMNGGIQYMNASGTIKQSVILPGDIVGVSAGSVGIQLTNTTSVSILKNTIVGSSTLVSLTGSGTTTIRDNILSDAGDAGVNTDQASLSGLTMDHNNLFTLWPYELRGSTNPFTPFPGTGEMLEYPGFVNPESSGANPNMDLRLAPSSPLRATSSTGGPMGAGGAVTYKTTLTASLAPTSPSGSVTKAGHTALFIIRLTAGAGGPASLMPGHDLYVEWYPGNQPYSVVPNGAKLWTGDPKTTGSQISTTIIQSLAPVAHFVITKRIDIPANGFVDITMTDDVGTTIYPQAYQGFRVELSRMDWSDGVVPIISDSATPGGLPLKSNSLSIP